LKGFKWEPRRLTRDVKRLRATAKSRKKRKQGKRKRRER